MYTLFLNVLFYGSVLLLFVVTLMFVQALFLLFCSFGVLFNKTGPLPVGLHVTFYLSAGGRVCRGVWGGLCLCAHFPSLRTLSHSSKQVWT